MRDKISFVLVAISSAIIGSICCIGPIASALVGIGAGAFFAKFSTLRTPFMIIAIASIGFGFYRVYFRGREILCEDGKCEVKTPTKFSKVSLWLATVIVIFLLIFPNITNMKSANANLPTEAELSNVIIKVQDLDCESCFYPIRTLLEEKGGIYRLSPDFSRQELEVGFDPKKIKVSDIISLINEAGFKVNDVKQIRNEK
jgi:mercuric ion transport protein